MPPGSVRSQSQQCSPWVIVLSCPLGVLALDFPSYYPAQNFASVESSGPRVEPTVWLWWSEATPQGRGPSLARLGHSAPATQARPDEEKALARNLSESRKAICTCTVPWPALVEFQSVKPSSPPL